MMYQLKTLYQNSDDIENYVKGYGLRLNEIVRDLDAGSVAKAIEVIENATEGKKSIFIIANGGSAAAASHFVNDIGVNSLAPNKTGISAFSLADNVESITAVANDAGFENIFAYQLQANMRPSDVIIAASVSGNSENIIRGVNYAKENGGYTIGWTGFEGGRLKKACDLCIHVPTTPDEYGPVEDIFTIIGHIISGYLTMKRGRFLHH
jgi:D-sedoheptulose 7-phosphate isomerase